MGGLIYQVRPLGTPAVRLWIRIPLGPLKLENQVNKINCDVSFNHDIIRIESYDDGIAIEFMDDSFQNTNRVRTNSISEIKKLIKTLQGIVDFVEDK